jgi:hypothetical protein
MNGRFTGTIEKLADIDVDDLADYLSERPVSEWNRSWGGFLPSANAIVEEFYPGCTVPDVGMFVLEPWQVHPAHTDVQPSNWLVRIHIPIITNKGAITIMDDGEHHMEVGKAYRFNTLATHAVYNGDTYRAHLVFDVLEISH